MQGSGDFWGIQAVECFGFEALEIRVGEDGRLQSGGSQIVVGISRVLERAGETGD